MDTKYTYMSPEDLYWENVRLRKLVATLELELQAERDRSFQSVELLMKGESLRQRIMLDAILGKFPPNQA